MPRVDMRPAVIGSRWDEKRSMTASARIHAALRDRIVALELAPGSALPEKEFAESFGVSRTPVREALLRLAEEQLVDIYPQSGTFVAPIRVSVVQDAMVIRNALERFAAGAAAARAGDADIAALDAEPRPPALRGGLGRHRRLPRLGRGDAPIDRQYRRPSQHLAGGEARESERRPGAPLEPALRRTVRDGHRRTRSHRRGAAANIDRTRRRRPCTRISAASFPASRRVARNTPTISRTRPPPRAGRAAPPERRARGRSCCIPTDCCLRTLNSARSRVGFTTACAICRSSRRTAIPTRAGSPRTSRSRTRRSFSSRRTITSTACCTARA